MKNLMLMAVLAVFVVMTTGCEYQSKTERRIAWFYKSENDGQVHKSRDIGNSTQNRHHGNKVDRFLRREVGDKINR
jgi:hypothetical protein